MHLAFLAPSFPVPVQRRHIRTRNTVPLCKTSDGPQSEFPSLLLGASEVMSRLTSSSADAAGTAQTMFTSAMTALGVSYNAPDSDDFDDVALPTEPPFNAVHAHMLAGYAFRAYEDPAPSCYREVRETVVSTPTSGDDSTGSTQNAQRIVAHYAVPDTNVLSVILEGVFLLKIKSNMEKDSGLYFVARVNEPIRTNCICDAGFSLLRRKSPLPCYTAEVDELVIYAYESESAYLQGEAPALRGGALLNELVMKARELKETQSIECEIELKTTTDEAEDAGWKNLFNNLPPDVASQLKLPFGKVEELTRVLIPWDDTKSISLVLDAVYVPFDSKVEENKPADLAEYLTKMVKKRMNEESAKLTSMMKKKMDEESSKLTSFITSFLTGKQEEEKKQSDLQKALEQKLPPGQMPLPSNWITLARGVREIEESTGEHVLREDIPQTLFVESHATDTQVWIFRDKENSDIVVSFRGTETTSWMDFQTDAQIWLQRWEPGGDIDLTMSDANTVGLAEVTDAVTNGRSNSTVPDDASCVHYGFLRAYHSVRDAVLHAINTLAGSDTGVGGKPYRYHFTGHSLGGALAALCASDFTFHYPHLRDYVSCVSFGAPKAGNAGFALRYNLLVQNSFRVVNDSDIVVRMPKSIGKRPCERYRHVGRTVLVNDQGQIWVEGDADAGVPAVDPFRERYSDANKLIEYEKEMWSNLVSGRSLSCHMEDSYYRSLTLVLAARSGFLEA